MNESKTFASTVFYDSLNSFVPGLPPTEFETEHLKTEDYTGEAIIMKIPLALQKSYLKTLAADSKLAALKKFQSTY